MPGVLQSHQQLRSFPAGGRGLRHPAATICSGLGPRRPSSDTRNKRIEAIWRKGSSICAWAAFQLVNTSVLPLRCGLRLSASLSWLRYVNIQRCAGRHTLRYFPPPKKKKSTFTSETKALFYTVTVSHGHNVTPLFFRNSIITNHRVANIPQDQKITTWQVADACSEVLNNIHSFSKHNNANYLQLLSSKPRHKACKNAQPSNIHSFNQF